MRRRVFRMVGLLLIVAALMIVTRQLIHVQAGNLCLDIYGSDFAHTTAPVPCTTASTAPAAPDVVSCGFDTPAQAVVGAITVPSTWTFYAPTNSAISSSVTLTQGSKWQVIGLNSTKQFYKIMIGCALVWILVGAIGPSPDAPNAGAPLPAVIVSDSLSTPN